MHAYHMGPAKDLHRVKGSNGELRVEGKTLVFVADDSRQVNLCLKDWADAAELAAELLNGVPPGFAKYALRGTALQIVIQFALESMIESTRHLPEKTGE